MSDAPAQLDYAQPPPWHRSKRFRRGMLLVVALAIASVLYFRGGRWLLRAELLYWQYRCLNYSVPPDEIIYDSGGTTGSSPSGTASQNETLQIAYPWDRYYALLSPPGFKSKGTLFLHERTSSNGTRYLVAVDLSHWVIDNDKALVRFFARTLKVPSLTSIPEEDGQSGGWVISNINNSGSPPRIRIFAGQVDPEDDRRFTIRLELENQVEIVDGWIQDNGDCDFDQRSETGSSTQPSP